MKSTVGKSAQSSLKKDRHFKFGLLFIPVFKFGLFAFRQFILNEHLTISPMKIVNIIIVACQLTFSGLQRLQVEKLAISFNRV